MRRNTEIRDEIINFEGYNFYISYPKNFEKKILKVLVFNVGSLSIIPNDLTSELPYDVLWYAETFAKSDYIFIAGNFPGHSASIFGEKDFSLLNRFLENLKIKFSTEEKINLLSYSAGAYFGNNYSCAYPEKVGKIGLLAPGINFSTLKTKNLKDCFGNKKIKIWHGKLDQNISYLNSLDFVQLLDINQISVKIKIIENKNHFDKFATSFEVLNFFNL
ncbi:MAG: hypothetical protein Fur0024_0560 [Patescibacteria group bacterium]